MKKTGLYVIILFTFFISCKSAAPGTSQLNVGEVKLFFTPCENGYLKIEALGKKYSAPTESLELKIQAADAAFTADGNTLIWNNYKIIKTDDGYELYYNDALRYSSSFYYSDGEIEEERYYANVDAYYGMGQIHKSLNLAGKRAIIYHEPNYGDQTYLYIPFYITKSRDSVYINANGYDKLKFPNNTEDPVVYTSGTGRIDSYYKVNDSFKSAVSNFYKISGESAMLPKWVFGFTQSKYSYKTSDEVIELVERFKKEDIPLNAVVLDLAWFKKMGDLDWNTENFPDPKALDEYLESNNVKLIAISEPFFAVDSLCYDEFRAAGIFADDEKGKPVLWSDWWCVNGSKNGAIINPLHPKAEKLLGSKYVKMAESGIDSFWTDLGEPEKCPAAAVFSGIPEIYFHNYFNREWSRIIMSAIQKQYPDKRFFILSRSGYTGSKSYAVSNWSGDVPATFDGLRQQLTEGLSSGLSGFPYWGSDVGGFTPEFSDPELMTRWYQFGAFTPVYRAHGTASREPWVAGEKNLPIIKKYIKHHYELIPYTYSLSREMCRDGLPLMRSMFLEYENTPAHFLDKQYFFGANILVSPITSSMNFKKETEVFLPDGGWYSWENMKRFDGGTHTLSVKMEDIPIFIKEGSITPLEYNGKTALLLTPAENVSGNFVFYDDDGISNTYKQGKYTEIAYELTGFTLKTSVINGQPANNVTLLVPAETQVKTSGWVSDGKYKTKTVELSDTIEL
ncbi:MAG: glycoside hydrolase family 31 protein [Spirochaetales bacterium]|nr:glycoside hydrolase family 31 protein [Spirochaetales bacterium]